MTLTLAASIVYAGYPKQLENIMTPKITQGAHDWKYATCDCHYCKEQDRREDAGFEAREQAAYERADWVAPEFNRE